MKSFIGAAGLALGVSAAVVPKSDQCCFQLTASGGASGTIGQLSDGQNRIGGGLSPATYCISSGGITDKSGRGCILTPPTTQFQCDSGATPTYGFSIGQNGEVDYNGSAQFYACPATDNGEYNLYTTPVAGQSKCVSVTLSTGGQCVSSGSASSSAPAYSSKSAASSSAPAYSSKSAQAYSSASAPAYTSKSAPAYSSASAPAYSSKSAPAYSSKSAASSAPAYSSKSAPAYSSASAPAYSSKSAPAYSSVASPSAVTITKYESAPAYSSVASPSAVTITKYESASVCSTVTETHYYTTTIMPTTIATQPAEKTTVKTVETYQSSASKPAETYQTSASMPAATQTPSATTPTSSESACPASLTGSYQTPHLIVPVNSQKPDQAYGTQYNATISPSECTIFNFDIPSSYSGKTCSAVFLFPEQSQLETSAYTFSGSGELVFSSLNGVASQQTTYNNAPSKKSELDSVAIESGNSYVISTGSCAAGTTQSIEVCSANGLSLEFFEDYNPSPLGLFITSC